MRKSSAIVLGNRGALGQAVEQCLIKNGWLCYGLSPRAPVGPSQVAFVEQLPQNLSVQAVICCAGRFEMNLPEKSSSSSSAAYTDQLARLWDANVVPAFQATHLASKHGAHALILCGSLAAFNESTSYALAYGACKAAVHNLAVTYHKKQQHGDKGLHVHCLLPNVLDTAQNRVAMPNADVSKWTSVDHVAQTVLALCQSQAQEEKGYDVFVRF